MPRTDRRFARATRPRAGLLATGLFLAALAVSAAAVPFVEPADAHATASRLAADPSPAS